MIFSSTEFLFAFLPITIFLYLIAPRKLKIGVLLVMSFIFYGWDTPKFAIIMAVSIVITYVFGLSIAKYKDENIKKAKLFLTISLILNLVILIYFKYTNFFIETIDSLSIFGEFAIDEKIVLPIGISFYTFQLMSYSIDIYRSDASVQKSIVPFAAYITLFPQLIAGPIIRYQDIAEQLTDRTENTDKFALGVQRFTAGLAKKVLIADSVEKIITLYNGNLEYEPTVLGAWLIVIGFAFQIYFDFSGYSDMAIGLGRLFGFEFIENFNYPYISKSITEFWRRWHISLSTWFKEYVYIPLGGNRKGILKQLRNIAVVWLLTGFWHGANWNYIMWGVYFGLLLIIEKLLLLKVLNKLPAFISHIYALFFILIGWLIFYFNDVSKMALCFKAMFGIGGIKLTSAVVNYDILRFLPLLIIAAIGSTPLPKKLYISLREKVSAFAYASPFITGGALFMVISYAVDATFVSFLYDKF